MFCIMLLYSDYISDKMVLKGELYHLPQLIRGHYIVVYIK